MPPRRRTAFTRLLTYQPTGSAQDVLDELRRVILAGGILPGTQIPLSEVSRAVGVSTIPVREALRQLIGEGLVEHRPNLGFATTRLTADEFAQLYLVRESLEQSALAASIAVATSDDDARVSVACESLEMAILNSDNAAYHVHSREFHLALVTPSGMSRLLHMLEMTWNLTEPVQPMSFVPLPERLTLHRHHRQMLDAFVARNLDELLAITREHNECLNSAISQLPPDAGLVMPDNA